MSNQPSVAVTNYCQIDDLNRAHFSQVDELKQFLDRKQEREQDAKMLTDIMSNFMSLCAKSETEYLRVASVSWANSPDDVYAKMAQLKTYFTDGGFTKKQILECLLSKGANANRCQMYQVLDIFPSTPMPDDIPSSQKRKADELCADEKKKVDSDNESASKKAKVDIEEKKQYKFFQFFLIHSWAVPNADTQKEFVKTLKDHVHATSHALYLGFRPTTPDDFQSDEMSKHNLWYKEYHMAMFQITRNIKHPAHNSEVFRADAQAQWDNPMKYEEKRGFKFPTMAHFPNGRTPYAFPVERNVEVVAPLWMYNEERGTLVDHKREMMFVFMRRE